MCGTVSSLNEQAKQLFEREGYTAIRKIWLIEVGANDSRYGAFRVELDIMSQRLVEATKLYDLDAIYIIREYEVYEKELRAGEKLPLRLEDELKELLAAG